MQQVTLLFLRRNNEILLAMKKRRFGAGKWNGVGGKTEPNETIIQAAVRECQEEIGVTPLEPRLVGRIKFYMTHDPEFLHDAFVYVTDRWEGKPVESEEMRPQWFALQDIPYKDMWPDDILWIPYLLEGKLFAGNVTIDGDTVASHTLKPVTTLENL